MFVMQAKQNRYVQLPVMLSSIMVVVDFFFSLNNTTAPMMFAGIPTKQTIGYRIKTISVRMFR
jgi:hypothetical protein